MSRPNDTIGAIAGYVLICVAVVSAVSSVALLGSHAAIERSMDEQSALAAKSQGHIDRLTEQLNASQAACFQHSHMCAAVEAAK